MSQTLEPHADADGRRQPAPVAAAGPWAARDRLIFLGVMILLSFVRVDHRRRRPHLGRHRGGGHRAVRARSRWPASAACGRSGPAS